MRRSRIVLALALLPFAASAWAQTPVVGSSSPVVHIDEVVARMMSFDRNHDGRVAADELLDRMQHLVTRGDADGSGSLDGNEIRSLAGDPPTPITPGGFPFSGHYAFGDLSGVSSRSHIEGAIDDLRLPGSIREQAHAVATTFVDTLDEAAVVSLLQEMEDVLTLAQLADFTIAVDREFRSGLVVTRFAGAVTPVNGDVRAIVVLTDPFDRRVAEYELSPEQQARARAVLERFRARFGDAERSALEERLADILSDEERADFRAALERRPLVATSDAFGLALHTLEGRLVPAPSAAQPAATR